MSNPASILEVALKAGVSTATVSRVLNRSAAVSPETAEAVLKCVRDLGYELPQRKPRTSRSKLPASARRQIAIIGIGNASTAWLDVPVIARAVRAVTRAAREQGFGVLLEETPDPSTLTDLISHGDIAGAVVWLSSTLKPTVLNDLRRRLPIVRAMGDQTGTFLFDHVAPNNRQVGALAYDYLEQHGCETFVCLSAHPRWDLVQIRAEGFLQSAALRQSEARPIWVSSDHHEASERQPGVTYATWEAAADAIVASGGRPIGLFTARDYEAARIYPLLTSRGLTLGRDVIVVSADNDPTLLAGLSPTPASLDLRSEEVGRRAFAQLLARMNNPDEPPVQILLTPRLMLHDRERVASRPSGE